MNDSQQPQYAKEPRARLGGLYEKQSAKGLRYFVGYFGGFKLLVMPEKNPEPGKPEWAVFAVERAAVESGQQAVQRPPAQATQAPRWQPPAQTPTRYAPAPQAAQHAAVQHQRRAPDHDESLPF